jgi:hypothetical protein
VGSGADPWNRGEKDLLENSDKMTQLGKVKRELLHHIMDRHGSQLPICQIPLEFPSIHLRTAI